MESQQPPKGILRNASSQQLDEDWLRENSQSGATEIGSAGGGGKRYLINMLRVSHVLLD